MSRALEDSRKQAKTLWSKLIQEEAKAERMRKALDKILGLALGAPRTDETVVAIAKIAADALEQNA